MAEAKHIKQVVEKLGEELYHVHDVHTTYERLFESSEETRDLLKDTDVAFFLDLQIVYLNYIAVTTARVLDPAATGKRKNLSFYYLLQEARDLLGASYESMLKRLNAIKAKAYNFTEPRNQLVAHLDLSTNLTGEGRCVPTFLSKEFEEAYSCLAEILNEVRERLGMAPSMLSWGVMNHGHGRKLIHRLEMAKAQINARMGQPDASAAMGSVTSRALPRRPKRNA